MNYKANLNILYLTENLNSYKSSEYQLDFLDNLKNYSNIYEYGPGYKNFNEKKIYQMWKVMLKINLI